MNTPPFDMSQIMELHEKTLAAMTRSWLAVATGVGAIAARQQELATTAAVNATEMLLCWHPGGDPRDAIARQGELATKTMDAAIASARDIAELMQKSGSEAFSAVQEQIVAEVAAWLAEPGHRAMLADLVLQKLPPTLAAIDRSGLPSLMGKQLRTELERVEIVPLAAGLVSAMVEKRLHQQLLDAALSGLESLLGDTPTMESARQRVIARLPAMVQLYRGEPVVMNKIIEVTTELITAIRADPAHPVRTELDAAVTAFLALLRDSPTFARTVDALKLDLLSRPELAELAMQAWQSLRDFVERDARSDDSLLRRHIEAMPVDGGGQHAPSRAGAGSDAQFSRRSGP